MFRHKTAFGGKVQSRKFENQATELLCQCAMLNRMVIRRHANWRVTTAINTASLID